MNKKRIFALIITSILTTILFAETRIEQVDYNGWKCSFDIDSIYVVKTYKQAGINNTIQIYKNNNSNSYRIIKMVFKTHQEVEERIKYIDHTTNLSKSEIIETKNIGQIKIYYLGPEKGTSLYYAYHSTEQSLVIFSADLNQNEMSKEEIDNFKKIISTYNEN